MESGRIGKKMEKGMVGSKRQSEGELSGKERWGKKGEGEKTIERERRRGHRRNGEEGGGRNLCDGHSFFIFFKVS